MEDYEDDEMENEDSMEESEPGKSGYKQLVSKLMMMVKELEKYDPEPEMDDEEDSDKGLVIMLGPKRRMRGE